MSQEKNPERTFDIRTLDFQLQRGIISQKEYDQYLKSLPNDDGNFEEVVIKEDSFEEDLDEDSFDSPEESEL
jgi:hypothetical protein